MQPDLNWSRSYPSLDQAVEDLRQYLPLLEIVHAEMTLGAAAAPARLARYGLTLHDLDRLGRVVAWLRDEAAVRAVLEQFVAADGTVCVSFTPELLRFAIGSRSGQKAEVNA
ncbi:MAG: hypothetical protein ACRD3D_13095 [Terriglobia bacterium]